jgi:hypothetical protein
MFMARRHGRLAKLAKAGKLTPEQVKAKIAERYNKKTPAMAERWTKAVSYAPERWAESMSALLGASVDPSFKEALRAGLEAAKDVYPKAIEGKGEVLAKHYYEKLTSKIKG